MMMASLKQRKARCLAYRNGKRCGRVATFVVKYTDSQGHHHQSVCSECKEQIMANGGTVIQENATGFMASPVRPGRFGSMIDRQYIPFK